MSAYDDFKTQTKPSIGRLSLGLHLINRVKGDPLVFSAVQAKHRRLPLYKVVAVNGEAHRQSFEVECSVSELGISAIGTGTSRQRAEQQAAKALLEKLGQ